MSDTVRTCIDCGKPARNQWSTMCDDCSHKRNLKSLRNQSLKRQAKKRGYDRYTDEDGNIIYIR